MVISCESLLTTSELTQSLRNQSRDERRKKLNWLSQLNFWATQKDIFDRAEPHTGKWLLNSPEFQSWIRGDLRTLWCPGHRGSPFEVISLTL